MISDALTVGIANARRAPHPASGPARSSGPDGIEVDPLGDPVGAAAVLRGLEGESTFVIVLRAGATRGMSGGSRVVRVHAARYRQPPENPWNRTLVCRYRSPAHSRPAKDVPLYTK